MTSFMFQGRPRRLLRLVNVAGKLFGFLEIEYGSAARAFWLPDEGETIRCRLPELTLTAP